MEDGIAYRNFVDNYGKVRHVQLIVPRNMRDDLLEMVHAGVLRHVKTYEKMNDSCRCMYFGRCTKGIYERF